MAGDLLIDRPCQGVDCPNQAGSLQCPTCLKLNIQDSFFCSQDCFKNSWKTHKSIHQKENGNGHFNPFPTFRYTGNIRPVYPLSPPRKVPKSIPAPNWAVDGIPKGEYELMRLNKIEFLDAAAQQKMRHVCRMAREVLDLAAGALRPGITTDEIDLIVHNACVERKSYPSPLNYGSFPKSVCTSVNEVVCHGIPDQRPLMDGDIINLDVSLYHDGYHADLNETYYVGDKARTDPDAVRVVETAREALDAAIKLVKPGALIRDFGDAIQRYAQSKGCDVVRNYVGHGVNTTYHAPPNIPHYARNKAVGACKPGMAFTIEPMVNLGKHRNVTWPDNWTVTTIDGKRSAQFEHTLLVTETGVEVLTARNADSPGGPVPMPTFTSKQD